jgi:hypothetical protein
MSRLKYDEIPIWENNQRLKDLQYFRDIYYLLQIFGSTSGVTTPTGKPFTREECRSEINRRLPAVKEMVRFADISALRDWVTLRKDDELVQIDVLEQLWYLEKLRLSYRAPSDVVEEAIGKYQADQFKSWVRTFNPFYWFGRLINWLISEAFKVVALVGANPETARNSPTGHIIFAIGKFLGWLACIVAAVIAVLEFLGFQTPIRHFFLLP